MEFIEENTERPIIFIDGSYYCFHRYYSMLNWWKNAKKDEPLEDPIENKEFVEKFKKLFIENVKNLPQKLNITTNQEPIIFVGKDCKREDIWRTKLFNTYKGTRIKKDSFKGGPFFKLVYEENLFQQAGANQILYHSYLEADDCIALAVKHVNNYKRKIYIITSDQDYLQLSSSNIEIWNLNYKKITDSKNCYNDPEKDLLLKIILGDKSDNIPSIFPKCGIKTAQKYVENAELLETRLSSNEIFKKQYEFNKTLIDFKNIPNILQNEFMLNNNLGELP